MMKNNESLQKDVQDAIKWEPLLHAAEIGVTAKDGIVTLTGEVGSYAKKLEAEKAAKNVAGVKAIVEKIQIKLPSSYSTTDNEIATNSLKAFKGNWELPNDIVKVKVENGWVTLDGELQWNFQRDVAKKIIIDLQGVKGVTSNITINADKNDDIEKRDIEKAMERNWSINNNDVMVNVSKNTVTLSGMVNSLYQKDEAERIAWNAPGVQNVENDLVVDYSYAEID